jgi:hypothetical protein
MATLQKEDATKLAMRALSEVVKPSGEGAPTANSQQFWSIKMLGEGGPPHWEERDIYDIRGRLLFTDRSILLADQATEWRVRVAADSLLGSAIVSISAGVALDFDKLLRDTEEFASTRDLTPTSGPTRLVCYSYPKLGLRCTAKTGDPVVVDLFEHTVTPISLSVFDIDYEQLQFAWSPFDLLAQSNASLLQRLWNKEVRGLQELQDFTFTELEQRQSEDDALVTEAILDVPLFGQIHPMACVPACFQMILKFHSLEISQESIGLAMHTSESSGTPPETQAPAISVITDDLWTGSLDETTDFSESQAEISNGRPLKEALAGHARVITGVRLTNRNGGQIKEFHINDPYPVGSGRLVWERWGLWTRFNYVYVRRRSFSR